MTPVSTQALLEIFLANRNLCTDTRKLRPGDLYWALKGARFDGNQFSAEALKDGAAIAVVDDISVIRPSDDRYVLVEDGLRALQDLARAFRRRWTIPVFGLTGSNGKTTTKELLAAAMVTQFRVHATAGNYNNHIGVPLTILACPDEAEVAIIEMGANQPGDIRELAEMAEPDAGLITNVGYAHIEKLLSLDGVMREKGQLFEVVKARQGQLFVNAEDYRVIQAAGEYEHMQSFGLERGDVRARVVNQSPGGMEVELSGNLFPHPLTINSPMSGIHNALNMAAAALVGHHFGLRVEDIRQGMSSYTPANHRSQLIDRGTYKIWMDAYNANPSSMAASIRHVMSLGAKKVALVIGDMKELGDQEVQLHEELGELISSLKPEVVIGVGDLIRHTLGRSGTRTVHFPNTEDASASVRPHIGECDLVLLKASRSVGLIACQEFYLFASLLSPPC